MHGVNVIDFRKFGQNYIIKQFIAILTLSTRMPPSVKVNDFASK